MKWSITKPILMFSKIKDSLISLRPVETIDFEKLMFTRLYCDRYKEKKERKTFLYVIQNKIILVNTYNF